MGKEEGSGGEKKRGGEVGKATWGRVKVLMGKWERQHEKGEGSWGKEEGGKVRKTTWGRVKVVE